MEHAILYKSIQYKSSWRNTVLKDARFTICKQVTKEKSYNEKEKAEFPFFNIYKQNIDLGPA